MKSTFAVKMDVEVELDLTDYDFHGGESREDIRKILIDKFFDEYGYEGIELRIKDSDLNVFDLSQTCHMTNKEILGELKKTI